MSIRKAQNIAAFGAGIAGADCARALTLAGHSVQVFDKSRGRYALPQAHRLASAESRWWDAAQGLGVCGDFPGGSGVEGAWLSAQSLCTAMLRRASDVADASTAAAAREAAVDSAHQAHRRRVA